MPGFRSRFARQVSDVFNGRRDVLFKPSPDPASGFLPACRRWWADRARDRLGRQRRWCLPFLGHLLDGNHHGNWRLNRSCRRKSCSGFWRPRDRRVGRVLLSRPRPSRPLGWAGKRYLRVYIHLRFRHACHETRDRQSRPIASWLVSNITKTKKRYLRVYIHQRFKHACHETKYRQSRSIVSGQEEGWGEFKCYWNFEYSWEAWVDY